MASLSGGMLLELVALELDGEGRCKLDALAEFAYVSQLCWLPPPPYRPAGQSSQVDLSSYVSPSLPRHLEAELVREEREIKAAPGVGSELGFCPLQDGRPTKGGLRVLCPQTNGANLRPDLTLFCVGLLPSPSSLHQLSPHSRADFVIYTNTGKLTRYHHIIIHSLLLLYFLDQHALFALVVYIDSLTAYTHLICETPSWNWRNTDSTGPFSENCGSMSSTSQIRTRLLILSDTHGHSLFDPQTKPDEAQKYAFHKPLPSADVAIHCGDLTMMSHVKEYQTTFDVMRSIDAPLKLVIPGNHDCSMDVDFWEKDVRAPCQTHIF